MMSLLKSRRVQAGAAVIGLLGFLLALGLNQALARFVFALPDGAEVGEVDLSVADAGEPGAEDEAPRPPRDARPRVLSKGAYIDPILRRNIFDSSKVGVVDDGGDPDADSKTDLPFVLMATVVASPEVYSSALIAKDDRDARALGYGIGDKLDGGDGEIVGIEQKRVLIKRNSGEVEYLAMGDDDKPRKTSSSGGKKSDDDSGISKEGDNEFVIERSVVDEALQNVDALASKIRVVPHKGPDGEIDGYRLSAIRRGSLFDKLGIKNGDIVHAVNGMPLNSTDGAFQAYQTLQSESNFQFEITRRNNRQTFKYEIR